MNILDGTTILIDFDSLQDVVGVSGGIWQPFRPAGAGLAV